MTNTTPSRILLDSLDFDVWLGMALQKMMQRPLPAAIFLSFVLASVSSADEFATLIHGDSLDGWSIVGGPEDAWTVEDGVLICRGQQAPPHFLRSDDRYGDFVLELEWKLTSDDGNSGVFLFADRLPRDGEPFPPSIEVQIYDGDHGSVFGIRGASIEPLTEKGQKGKTIVAQPSERRCHPVGQWNHYRINCQMGIIELEVNGKTVSRSRSNDRQQGFIALQAEGTRVDFRNIRIKRIARDAGTGVRQPPPKNAEEALPCFEVADGLRVELVAAEPLVVDPVSIDFGIDGRLWVAEYRDYPGGNQDQPSGRIRYLTDQNGDGRYDHATTFLDGVPFPTGVMEWRDGVLVASAPKIIYARDTDGDGTADKTTTLFDGFPSENFQARINGFRLGLDNFVHASTGQAGASLTNAAGKSIDWGRRDVRFDPDSLVVEPTAGLSQYGRVRDDWGNWFGNTNSNLLFHYPLEDRYLARNPHVASPSSRVFVPAEGTDGQRVFPTSRTLNRFNNPLHFNRVTSACSPEIYRDQLLGEPFYGDAFICEPVHNLVTRRELTRKGVTFRGLRAKEERTREFLSSTDNWFRPAQVRTGPGGGLWVVDMYRFVIEHPKWIGPQQLRQLDVRAGDDRGRIYRIVPNDLTDEVVRRHSFSLPLTTADLVRYLDSSHGVQRDLVHRQLLHRHRRDPAAVKPLEAIAKTSEFAAARVQALSILDALEGLSTGTLVHSLQDPVAEVRRHALRLSERVLQQPSSDSEMVVGQVLRLANDDDPSVRMQVACALGFSDDPRCAATLLRLLDRDHDDAYLVAASLASAASHLNRMLELVVRAEQTPHGRAVLTNLMRTAVGQFDHDALALLIRYAAGEHSAGRKQLLPGLLDMLEARSYRTLDRLEASPDSELGRAIQSAKWIFAKARKTVVSEASPTLRASGVKLLGREKAELSADKRLLASLLSPSTPGILQSAAADRLSAIGGGEATTLLLEAWPGFSPELRKRIASKMIARKDSAAIVLDAIENQTIRRSDISTAQAALLIDHTDENIRDRARVLLRRSTTSDREQLVKRYLQSLPDHDLNVSHGKQLFAKHCAVCHRFRGEGNQVGPDLETVTNRTDEELMIGILDPNRAVEPSYLSYSVLTVDGRVQTGRVAGETATTMKLIDGEGKQHQMLRTEIEALASMNTSLMPEGLEKTLTARNMADIIGYLRSGDPMAKSFAGNTPAPVSPDSAGALKLMPDNAEIYGPSLVFARRDEHRRVRTLTGWSVLEDQAVWEIEDVVPDRYEVWLDWMCDEGKSGDTFVISADDAPDRKLIDTAAPTIAEENWFRTKKIGELDITSETQHIRLAPLAMPKMNLFHLRSLILLPKTKIR